MDKFSLYKKELKARYEVIKLGDKAHFLLQPTDAKFRDLCFLVFRDNKNKNDLIIFSTFFGFEYGDGITQKLKNETAKFRPLQTYLKGETELAEYNYAGADMIAVLLDYKFRPYSRFITENIEEPQETELITTDISGDEIEAINSTGATKKVNRLKMVLALLIIAGVITAGIYATKKQCMQWKKDHFEMADCKCTDLNGLPAAAVYNYDENLFKMRRIYPTAATVFFDHEKPLVWYCKQHNEIEYFNLPGKHPVTGKSLKDMTHYMVNAHFKK